MIFEETENIELKQEFTSDIKKEVVAFANTLGGTIYVGIGDNGKIIGVENVDKVSLQAIDSIRNSIKPDVSIFVSHKIKKIDGKNIIEILVSRGSNTPYYIADKGLKPSGVYVRQGTASVPASDEMIKKMIKETDGDLYEELRSLNQDLTFKYIEQELHKNSIKFGYVQKKTLGIVGKDGLYTHLGLLLSDECKHTLKIAVFQDEEGTEFMDSKEFKGSVLRQLDEAYDYINFRNQTRSEIKGLYRIDERDYPEVAVREALINAIVHRDYSLRGSIIVNIYYNKIEFISAGGLDSGLTLDAILSGMSQSRNTKLSYFFHRLKLIEAYGTGIRKIIKSYKEFNKEVEIIPADGIFRVILPNVHSDTGNKIVKDNHKQIITENGVLKKEYQRIIDYIENSGSIKRKEVEELLNISQTKAKNILNAMLELNMVKKIGNGKSIEYII